MHHKVFGKVTTTTKKEKNGKSEKKNRRLATLFLIDFLFFIPHVKSVYILREKKQTDRPQNWLEMIGWKVFWLKK